MKFLAALILFSLLSPVLAQHGHKAGAVPMPPPERRMGWDERQRLREQVRNGQMTRDEARQIWREQRGAEPGRSPEERERLRRDVMDANRNLERR